MEPGSVTDVAHKVLAPLDGEMASLVDCYKDLHSHPELSMQEVRTAGIVADRLKAAGYEVTTGVGVTGVVGIMRNGDGPTVALRADMDGLPVREQTGLPYASEVVTTDEQGREVGVMHACGHDTHVACMITVADLLAQSRDSWSGTVMWLAQPAEETIAGAEAMLKDGLYERFGTPDVVLGQHVVPFPSTMVFHRPGAIMASTISLDVRIHGRGGHGSSPQTAIDPVVIASQIVIRLQTIVSREIDPTDPAVLTVGEIHAGTRANVIPPDARLALNVRTYDDKVQRHIVDAIDRIVRAEAEAGRSPLPPEITYSFGGPVTNNDAQVVDRVKAAHLAWFGPERVHELPKPLMGSEDFGLFARPDGNADSPSIIPTAFWFWGGAGEDQLAAAPGDTLMEKAASLPTNHNPGFYIDPESTLRTGTESLTVAALSYLGR